MDDVTNTGLLVGQATLRRPLSLQPPPPLRGPPHSNGRRHQLRVRGLKCGRSSGCHGLPEHLLDLQYGSLVPIRSLFGACVGLFCGLLYDMRSLQCDARGGVTASRTASAPPMSHHHTHVTSSYTASASPIRPISVWSLLVPA